MKQVIAIGCPGSSKSTFARVLAEKTGLPPVHLDRLFWNADRTTVEKPVFLAWLEEAMRGETWIIDGNYGAAMERRMAASDAVFFLDYPVEVRFAGVRGRIGKPRPDMPWVETEKDGDSWTSSAPLRRTAVRKSSRCWNGIRTGKSMFSKTGNRRRNTCKTEDKKTSTAVYLPCLSVLILLQHLAEEIDGSGFLRVADHLIGGSLLHDVAAVHEQDPVCNLAGEAHLVGHDHHGHAGLSLIKYHGFIS